MNRCLRFALLAALMAWSASLALAADERHPLTRALDYDTSLLLVLDLRLDDRQLGALTTAVATSAKLVAAHDQAQTAAMDQNAELLRQQFQALAEGTELTEAQQNALEEYRASRQQQREQLYGAVATQIDRLKRALSTEQAALVDWTVPAEVPSTPDEAAALDELRALAPKLAQAQALIQRMRNLIGVEYIQTRFGRVDDYLSFYYRPDTDEFVAARDWTLKLLDEARMLTENQWVQQAPVFASELLQRMGALEPPDLGGAGKGTRYGWWDLYDLLTDPQTPDLLQAMPGAVGQAEDDGDAN